MAGISISVEVSGFESLVRKLGASTAASTLARPLVQAQQLIREKLAKYPPPPPNSTYIRTGRLGEGWEAPVPTSLMAQVTNMVEYAPFVQRSPLMGDPHQTAQHAATGWPTDVGVVEESADEIGALFGAAIQEALDS
jgi:hypothetical protein